MVGLFISIVVIALVAGVAVWIVRQIPSAPPFVVNIIWAVAVVVILLEVLRFFGYSPGAIGPRGPLP